MFTLKPNGNYILYLTVVVNKKIFKNHVKVNQTKEDINRYALPFKIFVYELAGAYNEEFYSAYSGYYFIRSIIQLKMVITLLILFWVNKKVMYLCLLKISY